MAATTATSAAVVVSRTSACPSCAPPRASMAVPARRRDMVGLLREYRGLSVVRNSELGARRDESAEERWKMLLHSIRVQSSGTRSGSALAAQMNIFDRLFRVVRSYANAIVSLFEDPEKILDQAVLEMNDDLAKMRQATAQVLASQKRLENKYTAAQQASDDWYRRAQLALSKGDEDLAREALKRRKSYYDNANSLKAQLDQQKTVVGNLVSNTRLLETKIQEARSKKDTLKARAQTAKTATKVNEMLASVNTSSALAAFEKMEEKVLTMEFQADAVNQLTTDDLEGKFALLESSSVDDDLAALKTEIAGNARSGVLPPGRTSVSSSGTPYPFRDSEIERELDELRRKTKEY